MKTGIELITDERKRQIEVEGWTPEHDDEHESGELAQAAICYAAPYRIYEKQYSDAAILFKDPWPENWDYEWDKRERNGDEEDVIPNEELPFPQRIRNLVKAGALIAAEIDRLQRVAALEGKG